MVEQVGRYIVKSQIGKGAMGVVYLAEDPLLGRQAAIKTVDLSVEDPAERDFLRNRLLRDARAAAGLTHPNIVSVYDVVEEGSSAYLVLEFVPGDTLAARLIATPIPDYGFTTFVLRGMAAALDYTHARGIVHRDVKPANVMITPDGTPKIMDFGIARIADSRTNTPTGMVMGTIDYMSPEQIKGEPLDGRSDQFALGAMAVRMLSGQTLFGQHSMPTLAYKIVNEPVAPMRTRNASLPPAVDAVIARSLAKTAAERYPTCSLFVQDLATALAMDVSEPPTRTVSIPVAAPAMVPTASMTAPPAEAPAPVYATVPPVQHATPPGAFPAAARPQPNRRPMKAIGVIAAGLAVLGAIAGLAMWRMGKPSVAPEESVSPSATAVRNPPAVSEPPAAPSPSQVPDNSASPAPAGKEPPPKSVPSVLTATASGASKAESAPPKTPPASASESEIDLTPPPDTQMPDEETPPSDAPKPALQAYQEAQHLARDHQFAAAIAQYDKALSIRKKWPLAHFYRGRVYQQMNNCGAAIPDFDTIIAARPKYAAGYTYRGLCESKMKNDDSALTDFEQALAINPKADMALFGRGVVRNHRGASKKALEDLNAAIALMPAYPNAYQARAMARRKLGDAAGASADDAKAQDLFAAQRAQRRGN